MTRKKISPAKQARLDRIHRRDCPAVGDLEAFCLKCLDAPLIEAPPAPRADRELSAGKILGVALKCDLDHN